MRTVWNPFRAAVFALPAAALALLSGRAQGEWVQAPGPHGVRTNVLYKNGSTLYVGTDSRGVYRSSDNGAHWQPANAGIEHASISDIIVSGSNLLAAAANSCGVGVYKSTDSGEHWSATGLSVAVNSFGIKNGQVYAAALDLSSSIYKSTNNGNTWQQLSSPIQNGNEVFITGNAILVAEDNFIWRSTDDGGSWDPVEQFALSGVHSFAQSGNRIYGAGISGLYLSTDSGAHWQFSVFNGGALSLSSVGNTIYLGSGSRVSQSTDQGVTWHDASHNLGKGVIRALLYDGTSVWAGTSEDTAAVYVTSNGGANWLPSASGLPVAPTIRALIAMKDLLFAGMEADGIYRSSDNGDTWVKVGLNNPDLANQLVVSFCIQEGTLFAGSANGVFRSTDGGETFQTAINGFPTGGRIFVPSLTVSGDQLLAAASIQYSTSTIDAIFHSSDGGDSWHQSPFPVTSIFVSTVASDGSSTAFAGSYGESFSTTGLYKSTDSGLTWTSMTFSLMADIDHLAVAGNNVLAGTLFSAFYSTDGGENFAGSNPAGGGIDTYTLRDNFVFAGDGHGEFYSTSSGAVWIDANQGFPACPRPSVEASCANSTYLFAGTFENGVWRRPLSDFGIVTDVALAPVGPASSFLSQNYPNPFHGTTSLEFSLSNSERVRLVVYDVSGREVATLVDGPQAAGSHVVAFDRGHLASGVYFYRLERQGFTSTRSMVVAN